MFQKQYNKQTSCLGTAAQSRNRKQKNQFQNLMVCRLTLFFKYPLMQQILMIKNHYRYIIVGSGISALQAALILAQNGQQFIMLEAGSSIGGRICTLTLGEALLNNRLQTNFDWIEKLKSIPIECGATWISEDHTFMIYLTQHYKLTLEPQYYQGSHVFGLDNSNFLHLESMKDYFMQYSQEIKKLLHALQDLKTRLDYLRRLKIKGSLSQQERLQLSGLYEKYDKMNAYDFIYQQIGSQQLAKIIANQIQTLQCVKCTEFSALQLLADDVASLANVKYYIGAISANIDGFRVKQGMLQICRQMKQEIQNVLQKEGKGRNIDELIKLNHPVTEILNGRDPVCVLTQHGQYSCQKAIMCLPVSTMGRIQYEAMSQGKRLILNNQLDCNMTRMALVFKRPFWRPHHAGYASFSYSFPMNEMVDLSPSDQSCGILALVFTADGFERWTNEVTQECKDTYHSVSGQQIELVNKRKALQVIADIFFKGNILHQHIREVAIFWRSLSLNSYIGATYQATTAPGVLQMINQIGEDFINAEECDQPGLIVLGSDFSDDFGGYMEGAVRLARRKIFSLVGKEDPLVGLVTVKTGQLSSKL